MTNKVKYELIETLGIDENAKIAFISHDNEDVICVTIDENNNIVTKYSLTTMEEIGYIAEEIVKSLYDSHDAPVYKVDESISLNDMFYVSESEEINPYFDWFPEPEVLTRAKAASVA